MNRNLGQQFSVPIPEGTNIRRSGGLGHMPGDETHSITKMVPISTLKRYREFDREGEHSNGPSSERVISGIVNDIKSGGAIREPLLLMHNTEAKWGYLGEGHHRLIAAERAGLTHVPVSVYSERHSDGVNIRRNRGAGAPLTLTNPRQWAKGDWDSYQPRELHPDHFDELR